MIRPNRDVDLLRFARQAARQPFAWGRTDCVTLARQAWSLYHGRAILPALRAYRTRLGAWRAWRALGGWSQVIAHLDLVAVPMLYARDGDLLVWGIGERTVPHCAILVAEHVLGSDEHHGVRFAPVDRRAEVTAFRLHTGGPHV